MALAAAPVLRRDFGWRVFRRFAQLTPLDNPSRYCRAGAEAELGADTIDMALDGPFRQEELVGNLAIGHIVGNRFGDFEFTPAKRSGASRCLGELR